MPQVLAFLCKKKNIFSLSKQIRMKSIFTLIHLLLKWCDMLTQQWICNEASSKRRNHATCPSTNWLIPSKVSSSLFSLQNQKRIKRGQFLKQANFLLYLLCQEVYIYHKLIYLTARQQRIIWQTSKTGQESPGNARSFAA